MAEKLAFCQLLWMYRKSRATQIQNQTITVSGYCDDPTDCYRCPLLQHEISLHPSGHANWVCPNCLSSVLTNMKEQNNKYVKLTGHYSEGQCEYFDCTRPPRLEYGDSGTVIEVPKGYSRFLQLVIGDINK